MSRGALKALRRGDTEDDDDDQDGDDDDEGDDDKEMFNAVWAKVLSRHWKEVKDSDKDDDIEGWHSALHCSEEYPSKIRIRVHLI